MNCRSKGSRGAARPIRWQDVCDLDLVTEEEAATLVRLAPEDLEALRSEQAGPPFVRVGTAARYPIVELKRWIREQLRSWRDSRSETQAGVRVGARAREERSS